MKRGGIRDNYDDGGGISSACNSRRDRKSADPAARAAVRNKKMITAAICMGKTEEKNIGIMTTGTMRLAGAQLILPSQRSPSASYRFRNQRCKCYSQL